MRRWVVDQAFIFLGKCQSLCYWYYLQLFHINCLFYCTFYLSI